MMDSIHARRWIALGALLAGLAVGCGAFAAHGLDGYFAKKYAGEVKTVAGQEVPRATKHLADFRTGAEYQMVHSLGLIAVGLLMLYRSAGAPAAPSTPDAASIRGTSHRGLTVAAWSFILGILLFSGSLYALTLTGQTWLGAITPFGGTAFLVGWGALAMACWKVTTSPTLG